MDDYQFAGHISEVAPHAMTRVRAGQVDVMILFVSGTYYAFENSCPHQHYALFHQGSVSAYEVTCPMHGWSFDVRTGKAITGNGCLNVMDVDVRGNEIWIRQKEPGSAFSLF